MKTSYLSLFGLLLLFTLGLFWFDNILYFLYGIPQKFINSDWANYHDYIEAQKKVRAGAIVYYTITLLLSITFSIISVINMRNTGASKKIVFAIFGGVGISIAIILLLMTIAGYIGAETGRGVIG